MEPVPQTVEALRVMAEVGESELGVELWQMVTRVRRVVPQLVGFSLGIVEDRVTLTLVSSTEQLAALDAVQYADDGPCVAAVETSERVESKVQDLFDEERWLLFARATAALGVASSLSLPIVADDRVVGGVNLYASTADAFHGRLDEVAEVVGSSAQLAIMNADLSFRTLQEAVEAPTRVRESLAINTAAGIIAESQKIDIAEARQRLREAASRAGISEAQAAEAFRHVGGS